MKEKKTKKTYTFGEKQQEYSAKQGKQIDVWLSPKYIETKKKVIEMLEQLDYLDESDFWILMNETKTGKMGYTGLIISHNGCLKINDKAKEEEKFNPSSVFINENGYKQSLVFTYINEQQKIYEIGEVSVSNCKNDYPYAMALKRCFDRVVLKISKLAFYGVYSDSEADEFKEIPSGETKEKQKEALLNTPISEERLEELKDTLTILKISEDKFLEKFKLQSFDDINISNISNIENILSKYAEKK